MDYMYKIFIMEMWDKIKGRKLQKARLFEYSYRSNLKGGERSVG